MSDNEEIHKLLEGQVRLETKIDAFSKEQHSIKESIDEIKNELKTTTRETTVNHVNIENMGRRFDEFMLKNDTAHERIYTNMDKKESEILTKMKVWVMGGVISFAASVLFIYIRG